MNGDWYVPQLPVGAPLRVARPLGVGQASATMGVFVSDSADAANLPTPFVALYGVDYPKWHAGTLLHYGQIDLQRIGQRLGI